MTKFLKYAVLMVLVWPITLLGDVQTSDFDSSIRRARRDSHCRVYEEYLHGGKCCLNCPAGTRLASPCTAEGRMGRCEECDEGTYTEHSSGLMHCFRCTKCRSDEQIVKPCTRTQNAECQCRSGRFCPPDEACETCKKCTRCQKDEEVVRNCTSTSNTVCKKARPSHESSSAGNVALIISLSLVAAGILSIVVAFCLRRRCKATESLQSPHVGLKSVQHYSDDCQTDDRKNGATKRPSCSSLGLPGHLVRTKGFSTDERETLCESLSSSASNSQHSLTGPPPSACPSSYPPPAAFMNTQQRDDEEFLSLVPVNGEESLRKCFEYFEEIDVDYHKRFFRQLGIPDNVVKSKEQLPYEDRIHELLSIWVEKEGREGSLNHLLRALLVLNQRRTAETIKDNAIDSGHYCLSEG